MAIGETFDGGLVDAQAAREHADAAGVRVDAENVLYVRRAVLEEYEELKMALGRESSEYVKLAGQYGKDPVSVDAAVAFPERARALMSWCEEQVNAFLDMAKNLEAAARDYGYLDGDIAAMTPKPTSTTTSAWLAETSASIDAVLHPRDRV